MLPLVNGHMNIARIDVDTTANVATVQYGRQRLGESPADQRYSASAMLSLCRYMFHNLSADGSASSAVFNEHENQSAALSVTFDGQDFRLQYRSLPTPAGFTVLLVAFHAAPMLFEDAVAEVSSEIEAGLCAEVTVNSRTQVVPLDKIGQAIRDLSGRPEFGKKVDVTVTYVDSARYDSGRRR
jgi:hypothetical protein